jgi:hypothetical protein
VEVTSNSNYELPTNASGGTRSRRGQKFRDPPNPLSLILVLAFILSVFAFVRYVDFRLPTPLTTADLADNPKRLVS